MKILIADAHTFFREGLCSQLRRFDSVEEIREETDLASLMAAVSKQSFDLVFVDKDLLGEHWRDAFTRLRTALSGGRIILLLEKENSDDIWEGFSAGAHGCLTKYSPDAQNINALRLIMDGISYVPPAILATVSQKNVFSENEVAVLPSGRKLTTRQREVLELLSIGLSNKEIAYCINVSEATVKLHINALLRNLHVKNRTKAVITAQMMGLL